MATYQIMYWHNIPRQIKAKDETGTVKKFLPDRFQKAIDSAALAARKSDGDAYLDGWKWGPKVQRTGSAADVAEALLAELDEAYPKERLREIIMAYARKKK